MKQILKLFSLAMFFRLLLIAIGFLAYSLHSHTAQTQTIPFEWANLISTIDVFSRADFEWYVSIVDYGYERRPFSLLSEQNWAFFPLWPLVLKASKLLHYNTFINGLIICNLFFLASIALMYVLLKKQFKEKVAFNAVILLIVSPFSYLFFRPGPESMFLFLILLSFYLAYKNKWLFVGFLGALATLTRVQGIVLLLPLIIIYFKHYFQTKKHNLQVLSLALMPLSLFGFMLYMKHLTGNLFASFQIQKMWGNELAWPFYSIYKYFQHPIISSYSWDLSALTVITILFSTGLVIFMFYLSLKNKFPWEYFCFSLGLLAVDVCRTSLMAGSRYLIPIFPIYALLALVTFRQNFLYQFFITASSALQCFIYIFAVYGYNWPLP